jgi:hypothetical protein
MRILILTITLLMGGALAAPGTAVAGGLYGAGTLWLSCENGGRYALHPIAVSDEGDLVAGQLVLGRGQGLRVRLIPMGGGYRYAGRGVWFDGWRESVYLFLSKHRPVACTVAGGPEQGRGLS